jgi:hypothetical protein
MGFTLIWQAFVVGVAILGVAILVNALATLGGVTTWYGFLAGIREEGLLAAIRNEGILSLLFLFLLYPLVLGLTGYFVTRWLA